MLLLTLPVLNSNFIDEIILHSDRKILSKWYTLSGMRWGWFRSTFFSSFLLCRAKIFVLYFIGHVLLLHIYVWLNSNDCHCNYHICHVIFACGYYGKKVIFVRIRSESYYSVPQTLKREAEIQCWCWNKMLMCWD